MENSFLPLFFFLSVELTWTFRFGIALTVFVANQMGTMVLVHSLLCALHHLSRCGGFSSPVIPSALQSKSIQWMVGFQQCHSCGNQQCQAVKACWLRSATEKWLCISWKICKQKSGPSLDLVGFAHWKLSKPSTLEILCLLCQLSILHLNCQSLAPGHLFSCLSIRLVTCGLCPLFRLLS